MHIKKTALFLLAILNTVHVVITAPLNTRDDGFPTDNIENFSSTDDSGAIYDLGTAVEGTSAWRDSNGYYHGDRKRSEIPQV